MKLTLDRLDLKPEFEGINCSQTRLEHFQFKAQMAICAVGDAQFREYDGRSYNRIMPIQTPDGTCLCEHCHAEPAIFRDMRGLDVISAYWLGEKCAAMTDEEFFGIEPQTPSGAAQIETDPCRAGCLDCTTFECLKPIQFNN